MRHNNKATLCILMLAEKLKIYFLFFISGSTLNVSFVQRESVKACYHKSRIMVNFFNQSQTSLCHHHHLHHHRCCRYYHHHHHCYLHQVNLLNFQKHHYLCLRKKKLSRNAQILK